MSAPTNVEVALRYAIMEYARVCTFIRIEYLPNYIAIFTIKMVNFGIYIIIHTLYNDTCI